MDPESWPAWQVTFQNNPNFLLHLRQANQPDERWCRNLRMVIVLLVEVVVTADSQGRHLSVAKAGTLTLSFRNNRGFLVYLF